MSNLTQPVELISTNSKATISTMGASVVEWWVGDDQLLWSGDRPDGGYGTTHPCIPNFNIANDYPNHGFARKSLWDYDGYQFKLSIDNQVNEHPIKLDLTRIITLADNAISITTTITNQSKTPTPINIADHTYFACPPGRQTEITINDHQFGLDAANDKAYAIPLQETNTVEIPTKPLLILDQSGYSQAVLWSLPGAEFACIEPVQVGQLHPTRFHDSAPKLESNATTIFEYTLSLSV